ncbi:MAG TPA: hypothetical protein VNI57_01020, partial [Candidatus Saccharimonadales bacterium]|nr:hypothetical protein [Candidatus Saccharimonadales bacterium]
APQSVEFTSPRWEIRGGEARVEQHLGRESLYLKGGTVTLRDVDFLNGVIEFDIAVTGKRGFVGAVWRLQDDDDYEEFYIRPHQSGNPDACQYTPVYGDLAAWQLYYGEGYGAPVKYRFDAWMHVRIVVSGKQGEVSIDSNDPVLYIRDMKREAAPGKIGVTAAKFAPAWFSGFSYTPMDAPALKIPDPAGPPRISAPGHPVERWMVSTPFAEASLAGKYVLTPSDTRDLSWVDARTEPSGILNLASVRRIAEKSDTVFARVTVRSDRVRVRKISFGFSDRAKIWFNGRLVYGGDNGYLTRDYRYLGTIGLFEDLYLPLRKGDNEILFAVSESFGGWGLLCWIDDLEGIDLLTGPPAVPAAPQGP